MLSSNVVDSLNGLVGVISANQIGYWHLTYLLQLTLLQYPTKALAPLMLEDYRKVMVDRRGEEEQFSYENILECMKKGI